MSNMPQYTMHKFISSIFVGFLSILRQGGRPMGGFMAHSKLHLGVIAHLILVQGPNILE